MEQAVKKQLNEVFSKHLDGKNYDELKDTQLKDLPIDSVDFIDMIFDIEDALGVNIMDENFDNDQTVTDFISLFEKAPE